MFTFLNMSKSRWEASQFSLQEARGHGSAMQRRKLLRGVKPIKQITFKELCGKLNYEQLYGYFTQVLNMHPKVNPFSTIDGAEIFLMKNFSAPAINKSRGIMRADSGQLPDNSDAKISLFSKALENTANPKILRKNSAELPDHEYEVQNRMISPGKKSRFGGVSENFDPMTPKLGLKIGRNINSAKIPSLGNLDLKSGKATLFKKKRLFVDLDDTTDSMVVSGKDLAYVKSSLKEFIAAKSDYEKWNAGFIKRLGDKTGMKAQEVYSSYEPPYVSIYIQMDGGESAAAEDIDQEDW